MQIPKTLSKLVSTSGKEKWLKKFEKWPSIALVVLEWSGFILFYFIYLQLFTDENSFKAYLYTALRVCLDILIVVFSTIIGVFLYEANRRQLTWLWKKVLRRKDEEIAQYFSSGVYSCSYMIWIIRIVGLGLALSALYILSEVTK